MPEPVDLEVARRKQSQRAATNEESAGSTDADAWDPSTDPLMAALTAAGETLDPGQVIAEARAAGYIADADDTGSDL